VPTAPNSQTPPSVNTTPQEQAPKDQMTAYFLSDMHIVYAASLAPHQV
jgi:hypothetical protein